MKCIEYLIEIYRFDNKKTGPAFQQAGPVSINL
jgi:hypothetical protein